MQRPVNPAGFIERDGKRLGGGLDMLGRSCAAPACAARKWRSSARALSRRRSFRARGGGAGRGLTAKARILSREESAP